MMLTLGAWAQPPIDGFSKGKGNLDLVGGLTFESFSKYFAHDGPVSINRATTAFSIFAAAGITDRLDAQINIPVIYTKPDQSGLQDLSIFLKYAWIKRSSDNHHFTLGTALGFSTPMMDYPTQSLFAIGQQATSFDGRIYGQYRWPSGWFVMAQTGYTYRLDPVPSSTPAALKIGLAKAKYYWDVWYDFQHAYGGNDYRDGNNASFRTFGVSYHKVGGTFYKPFSSGKSGVALGAFFVISGRNIGQSIGVSGAYIYKIKYRKN
ncbi:hypothetical protein KFE98_14040 [bacterium SCSIO 12741]|nr:hypothetical protein KFE98_14040 [bacterium SCSIO 12741]